MVDMLHSYVRLPEVGICQWSTGWLPMMFQFPGPARWLARVRDLSLDLDKKVSVESEHPPEILLLPYLKCSVTSSGFGWKRWNCCGSFGWGSSQVSKAATRSDPSDVSKWCLRESAMLRLWLTKDASKLSDFDRINLDIWYRYMIFRTIFSSSAAHWMGTSWHRGWWRVRESSGKVQGIFRKWSGKWLGILSCSLVFFCDLHDRHDPRCTGCWLVALSLPAFWPFPARNVSQQGPDDATHWVWSKRWISDSNAFTTPLQ